MELTIDFLSFRPCEREDMMLSSVYDQGRVQARCYRRQAATVKRFTKGLSIGWRRNLTGEDMNCNQDAVRLCRKHRAVGFALLRF